MSATRRGMRCLAVVAGAVLLLGLAGCGDSGSATETTSTSSGTSTTAPTVAPSLPPPSPSPSHAGVATQPPVKAGTGRILSSPCADLRSAARTSSSPIGCVPHGTIVTIGCTATGTSVTGPYGATAIWDHTTYQGKSGYLSDADVFTGKSGPAADKCRGSTPATGSGWINQTPCLDLHTGPNIVAVVVTCVPHKVVIQINCTVRGTSVSGPYGASTIWDHTTYHGKSGYVSDAYVYTGKSGPVAAACPGVKADLGNGRVNMSPCLDMRTSPSTGAAVVQCVPDNVLIRVNCTASGTSVTGPYGASTIWDHTTYKGKSGYLSDAYVYTGVSGTVAKAC